MTPASLYCDTEEVNQLFALIPLVPSREGPLCPFSTLFHFGKMPALCHSERRWPPRPLPSPSRRGRTRIPRAMTVAARWRHRRGQLNFRGGQMRHQEEKPKVGRDVEVEVDQSMHEESRARNSSRKLQSPWKREIPLPEQ